MAGGKTVEVASVGSFLAAGVFQGVGGCSGYGGGLHALQQALPVAGAQRTDQRSRRQCQCHDVGASLHALHGVSELIGFLLRVRNLCRRGQHSGQHRHHNQYVLNIIHNSYFDRRTGETGESTERLMFCF